MTPAADLIDETRIAGRSAPASGGKPELVLKSSEFRKGREEGWRELEKLVGRVERRGVARWTLDELQQPAPALPRGIVLAVGGANIALDRNLLLYLENLACGRISRSTGRAWPRAERDATFLVHDLPAAVRAAAGRSLARWRSCRRGGRLPAARDEAWMTALSRPISARDAVRRSRADLLRTNIRTLAGSAESFGSLPTRCSGHNTLVGLMSFGLGLMAGIPTLMLSSIRA